MKAQIHIGLVVKVDKLLASSAKHLSNRRGRPGGEMKLHFGVGDQVAVLLEVVSHTDQLIMPLDHETVKVGHIEAHMEVTLRLELLQQIMGFQKVLDRGLKRGRHRILHYSSQPLIRSSKAPSSQPSSPRRAAFSYCSTSGPSSGSISPS